MKKTKLTLFAVTGIAFLFLANSCAKNAPGIMPDSKATNTGTQNNSKKSHNSSSAKFTNNAVWVTLGSDGNYTASYEVGIFFGSYLPHPTGSDPYGIYDGEPIPIPGAVGWLSSPGASWNTVDGPYFDLFLPTISGSPTEAAMLAYSDSVNAYFADTTGTVADPIPLGTTTGASNGVVEARGMLVRDHTSPTLMSVCNDTYKYTPPGYLLGAIFSKSPYTIYIYGPTLTSGTVSKIVLLNSGSVIATSAYSLTYAINSDGSSYHIVGTITITSGNVLTINDDIQGS